MKILLLNQPVYNRGDEAAHRNLIRTINNSIPNALITIVLENIKEGTIEQIRVDNPNNTYININTDIGYRKSRIFSICSNLMIVSFLIRSNRVLANYIKESDIVICAPGGICLGGFYNWSHLYIMKLCNYLAKPIIYYSRSIGPFNPQNILQKFFCSKAQTVLKNVDFLSLRDAKSMDLADTLSISYIKAIDSAFLDVPNVKAPDSVKSKVSSKPYVVFVPNQLTWHPTFCNMTQESIDKSYLKMIEIIACKTDYNIVMLPQLYLSNKSDYEYFKRLQHLSKYSSRIIVLSDTYSSDIQQSIIRSAQMIIGARYHSIIFGINNLIPVIALNYEHKIAGTLDILEIKRRSLDFNSKEAILNFDYKEFEHLIISEQPSKDELKKYAKAAHQIAKSCFNTAFNVISKYNS